MLLVLFVSLVVVVAEREEAKGRARARVEALREMVVVVVVVLAGEEGIASNAAKPVIGPTRVLMRMVLVQAQVEARAEAGEVDQEAGPVAEEDQTVRPVGSAAS